MPPRLFVTCRNDASDRTAIVSEDGDSVWLYLTQRGTERPERDCWLLNTLSAPELPDPTRYRSMGQPPPPPFDELDSEGAMDPPQPSRWSFRWSLDGDAVLVAVDGVPIGAVGAAHTRGFSRYLRRPGPWGKPWDATAVATMVWRDAG